MYGESEVKAQIKLLMTTGNKMPVVVVRSFQVRRVKGAGAGRAAVIARQGVKGVADIARFLSTDWILQLYDVQKPCVQTRLCVFPA